MTCSPEDIPAPLVDQLKEGGQMVIPVGRRFQQALCLITKRNGNLERKVLESTFFIPMTGRAEELRSKRADDGVPELINGGFEDAIDPNVPAGWYYLRQLRLVTDSESPEGNTFVALANRTPDRAAQALQAFGIDGRRFQEIRISAMVRRKSIRLVGRNGHSGIDISFYDERRARVGAKRIGPWTGSAKWTLKTSRLRVPPNARLAVLAIGLFGATGELSIDKLQVRP